VRIVSFPDWFSRANVEASAPQGDCAYYGIAIGPDSDEGIVNVNGYTLQAGHPLALRSTRYTISNVRPVFSPAIPIAAVKAIAQLQIMLFESPEELAIGLAGRPDRPYNSGLVNPGTTLATAGQLFVPFVGRKRCLVQLIFNGGAGGPGVPINYSASGFRYSPDRGFPEALTTLVTVTNVTSDSNPGTGTIAFYIENEIWEALWINVWYSAAPATSDAWIDAITSGEHSR
jgi:hypothetical protein